MLSIYNSLSQQKQVFTPQTTAEVKLYVCGMTVYDYCHLGHAKAMIAFDVVVRYLRYLNYKVNYIRNITDIDDKIIQRAQQQNIPWKELTVTFIAALQQDAKALYLLPPTQEPKATDHIAQMIAMIEQLVQMGYAYQASSGDVYYAVHRFQSYGKLAHKNLADLQAGSRVAVTEDKRDPLDFVLWKSAKPEEPHWPSPWGPGRPGWHIECSAMATHYLGPTLDIHGGGCDLMFPHHENEVAQSEAVNQQPFANYWMHNGFVEVDGEKMSKSLGNFFTIRDLLARYSGEVLRYFIIGSHYRSPLHYNTQNIDQAQAALTSLYLALRQVSITAQQRQDAKLVLQPYVQRFQQVMDDDFNTPEALALLHELAKAVNRAKAQKSQELLALAVTLSYLADVLGLLQQDVEAYLRQSQKTNSTAAVDIEDSLTDDAIEALIEQRQQARANKDWQRADEIRDQLQTQGVILEDMADKTLWRRE